MYCSHVVGDNGSYHGVTCDSVGRYYVVRTDNVVSIELTTLCQHDSSCGQIGFRLNVYVKSNGQISIIILHIINL